MNFIKQLIAQTSLKMKHNLTYRRFSPRKGFSLVELMVVVAIMGTLAAIAIPAYNEYRKSAKKTAYKSDLMGLHKGWLAFGVELDNFCERTTQPSTSSITNVGMTSLTTSKLYGTNGAAVAAVNASCATGTLTPAGCSAVPGGANPCTGCSGGGTFTAATPALPAGNGPGKHSFIGFTAQGTTCGGAITSRQIIGNQGSNGAGATTVPTSGAAACNLTEVTYEMGVYGQLTGVTFFGVSINHSSVISTEFEGAHATNANPNC